MMFPFSPYYRPYKFYNSHYIKKEQDITAYKNNNSCSTIISDKPNNNNNNTNNNNNNNNNKISTNNYRLGKESQEYFEILGFRLFYDDLLIIGLIFLLIEEGVNDHFLIISLILLIGD